MKSKSKKLGVRLLLIALAAIVGYSIISSPLVSINNQKLKKAVKSIDSDLVQINEIIPFDWDVVYTFEPYASRESIEETIGFKSRHIKVNDISEGMVHLLFIKDKKVVASVLGYSTNLGYSIGVPSKITFTEKAKFNVTVGDGITNLWYAK